MSHSFSRRARRALTLGLVLCPLALVACEDDSGLGTVRPKLVVEPDSGQTLEFDTVVLTRTEAAPRTIIVRNEGAGPLTLQPPTLSGVGGNFYQVVSYPRELAPSAQGRIVLRFVPQAPVVTAATLTVASNDPDRPEVTWTLVGTAREPCVLYADQSAMVFAIGDKKVVNLTSLSSHECVVERIAVDRRVFAIVDEPAYPLTVPAGGQVPLTLEHFAVSSANRGIPVRIMTVYEDEGGEVSVRLEGEAPLFGCLSARPDELIYPQTEIGQSQRQRVTVTNSCGKAASITSVVVSRGWNSYRVDDFPTPAAVPPQSSVDVWVTYAPRDASDEFGQLAINTNDATLPRFRVQMSGPVSLPAVTYFPNNLDFGSVIYRDITNTMARSECSSATRTVKVYSTGSAPLRVDRLELSGADGYFEVNSVTVEGVPVVNFNQPFSVPADGSAELTLQFYPTRSSPDRHQGRLSIFHNASAEPAVVDLTGLARADGPARDEFTQLEGPKADILWVIDNSCSMFDEQARLIQNLSGFVALADSINSDYQMAVTVTDAFSSLAGTFEECYPHPRVIGNTYARRENAFRCLFEVGINGSGREAGLGAARQALLRAQAGTSIPLNPNVGFLRDDASLAIVVMSDEEDQSIESQALLRDYFWSVKGPSRVKLHAIAGPVTGPCPTDRNIAPGIRYKRMTEDTGGQYFSICEADWGPVLEGLGLNVFTPLSEWQLSQAAVPSSVTVVVDGVPVPWDAVNGFVYDASSNTVRFNGTSVPRPSAQIDVEYLGNCRP
jgi:hypothetical protein